MNFFDVDSDSFNRRRSAMSTQTFQTVRRLQESGVPLPVLLANPAWQSLLDRIDSNITQRTAVLETSIRTLPLSKRTLSSIQSELGNDSMSSKRARTNDLESRKKALLAGLGGEDGDATDSYEAYRTQSWMQYYEWMDKQKDGTPPAPPARLPSTIPGVSKKPQQEETPPDEDEEIHNALLGLS
jgi:hypothetical protein